MAAAGKALRILLGTYRSDGAAQNYVDPDVCRHFLCGLCPCEIFQDTTVKVGMEPCPKIYSLNLRREYEQSKAAGAPGFENELIDVIKGSDFFG